MENQTAVEWLKSELHRQCMFDGFAWEDRNYFMKLLDQAKAMEAQQLESCAMYFMNYTHECLAYHKPMDGENKFEQYYFETYGK